MAMLRRLPAAAAMLAVLLASAAAVAQTPAELLAGRWQLVSQQQIVDGEEGPDRPVPDKSGGIWVYAADGSWHVAAGPLEGARGTYRWIAPDRIRSVTVSSPMPSAVGVVRTVQVEVDDRRLRQILTLSAKDVQKTSGPAGPGTKYPQKRVVISTFQRLPD